MRPQSIRHAGRAELTAASSEVLLGFPLPTGLAVGLAATATAQRRATPQVATAAERQPIRPNRNRAPDAPQLPAMGPPLDSQLRDHDSADRTIVPYPTWSHGREPHS